jgi:deazaflavin-dependent oxidoreductase (nitroreductase family)
MTSRPRNRRDRLRAWWRYGNRLEAFELRWLGTSGMSILGRKRLVLIETTGRKTGKRRRTPVAHWREGGDAIFIGGGAAGMSRVDWIANVRAQPACAVWIKRKRIPVVATELSGAEYDAARAYALERWPFTAKYEAMSGRRVPYFRLDPL